MNSDKSIRMKVREAIREGKLPTGMPDRTWGGRGTGGACCICDERVKPEEIEFELEFTRNHANGAPVTYRVHLQCFAAWNTEQQHCVPAEAETGRSSSGSAGRASLLPAVTSGGTMSADERDVSDGKQSG